MTEQPKRRGRPPKMNFTPMPDAPNARPASPGKRRKNVIGTNMPYVAPQRQEASPMALGYRPKKKPSRPLVQPNRI